MAYTDVTDETFQSEVLDKSMQVPVVVDLWAPWCGPCVQLSPLLDAVAAENAGRFTVAKINVDENPQLAASFGVRSIPTLLFFKDGTLRDQLLGGAPKRVLVEKLTALEAAASLN